MAEISLESLNSLAEQHARLDYGDKTYTDRANALAEQIGNALATMSDKDLSHCMRLGALKDWAAYKVLERDESAADLREYAIDVLRAIAEGEGPEALAARWKLEEVHGGA